MISRKLSTFKKQVRTIERLKQVIESQKKTLQELALEYVSMGDQALAMDDSGVVEEGSVLYGKRLDDIAIRSALANYNKALRIVPDCIDAMIGKARLLMALDQLESAEKELEKAMELDTGARALRAVLEEYMLDIMYEIPKDDSIGEVVITKEYVNHTGGPRIMLRG